MKSTIAPRVVVVAGAAVLFAVFAVFTVAPAAAAAPPAAEQIAAAIQAAPAERRDGGCARLRRKWQGGDVAARQQRPHLPLWRTGDDVWSVACYHKDLEPFMARGRELAAQGVSGKERTDARLKEVDDGKLAMPKEPRALYVLHGSGFDAATGTVKDAYLRWVIYTPYATHESTGLSTKPAENAPWLMDAGKAGAHIMITPPRPKKP